jgi:exodeoxyribonuclease V alpha subunit
LGSTLLSHQLGRGHVCLWLKGVLADPYNALSLPPERSIDDGLEPVCLPSDLMQDLDVQHWASCLRHPQLVAQGAGLTPLVFDGQRLYLRRYWQYERSVEAAIEHRLRQGEQLQSQLSAQFVTTLQQLFPEKNAGETDWQKAACALAVRSGFCVITGGPGTGKTTTVVKLLALLQRLALTGTNDSALRIKLAAPTGKAAARLKESIAGAIDSLPPDLLDQSGLRAAIPTEVITLHRLLGSRPHSRQFKHDARNPLIVDVLVVDEASMVDLEMMAALLAALPAAARLILLGDKGQLASVEAGSVLGQLCSRADGGHFDASTATWLHTVTGETVADALIDPQGQALDQHVVMLRKSYRFTEHSGIGQLAKAVNANDPVLIDQVWDHGYSDLNAIRITEFEQVQFRQLVIGSTASERQGYKQYLTVVKNDKPDLTAELPVFDQWARKVLDAYSQFQVLCALRTGLYGVEGLNQRITHILQDEGLIQAQNAWFAGRPVLVTQNDYRLGLMNGDIGIALPYPLKDKQSGRISWGLRVAFAKSDGSNGIHWLLPSRLLSVETVFALTVHKSQGSEFSHCVLILPPKPNPVLTRELVYTGITRAKRWFTLVNFGKEDMLKRATERLVMRSGRLFG